MAGHHLVHLLSCGAVLFMLLAPHSGGAAMTAAGTAGAGAVAWPPLTVMLAAAMTATVVVTMDRFPARAPAQAGPAIDVLPGHDEPGLTCMLVQMV